MSDRRVDSGNRSLYPPGSWPRAAISCQGQGGSLSQLRPPAGPAQVTARPWEKLHPTDGSKAGAHPCLHSTALLSVAQLSLGGPASLQGRLPAPATSACPPKGLAEHSGWPDGLLPLVSDPAWKGAEQTQYQQRPLMVVARQGRPGANSTQHTMHVVIRPPMLCDSGYSYTHFQMWKLRPREAKEPAPVLTAGQRQGQETSIVLAPV